MSFKKYNTLLVALLLFIVSICALACRGDVTGSATPSGSEVSLSEIELPNSGVESQTASVPTFTNAWSAYNYANKIMNTGKGWYSETRQSCLAMNFTQTVNIDRWSDNNGKAMMKSTCNGAVSFFECLYMDGDKVTNRKYNGSSTYGVVPNFTQAPRTIAKDAFKAERGVLPAMFPHTINNKTAIARGFVCNGEYYKFRMILEDSASLDYKTQVNYLSGSSTWPVLDYIYIDYVVDVKTGYFVQSVKYEKYTITMFGIKCQTTAVSTEMYRKMNVSIDITPPDYLGL